jgi:DNA-binding CsgD family transcriptional regulator
MAEPAAPLTARENEVAELVADGMTNAEIARMLNLSRRTIEVHLDHVRQKLGARSRVGVATWVLVRSIRRPTSPS